MIFPVPPYAVESLISAAQAAASLGDRAPPDMSIDGVYDTLPPFLEKYGYFALNGDQWIEADGGRPGGMCPQLELEVTGHEEVNRHTVYNVQCKLTAEGLPQLEWPSQKRLVFLRHGLHDQVKFRLGITDYREHFGEAPFAHKGGIRGTTNRLNKWLAALAKCINIPACKPAVVALTLHFFEVPEVSSSSSSRQAVYYGSGSTLSGNFHTKVPTSSGHTTPVEQYVFGNDEEDDDNASGSAGDNES